MHNADYLESYDDGNGGSSFEEDTTPLLDMSNDVEQKSDAWPIDPEGNSVIITNSSQAHRHYFLKHPFGRPNRFLFEVFIMINMA